MMDGKPRMAHVLFLDVVAYSRLPTDRQAYVRQSLREIVRAIPEFSDALRANEVISRDTGDGMALAFFGDLTAPVHCARQISQTLAADPAYAVRMGIHSGPVFTDLDINSTQNLAGDGINIAQRVMDCGDSGHILASEAAAQNLGHISDLKPALQYLDEVEVKHGTRIRIYNVCLKDQFGNPELPAKIRTVRNRLPQSSGPATETRHPAPRATSPTHKRRTTAVLGAAALVAAVTGFGVYLRTSRHSGPINSIAVLPLEIHSNDPDAEYISDGITESVNNTLSRLPGLRVVPHSIALRYKGKTTDAQKTGGELEVQAVLAGRITQRGDDLTISVEMDDIRNRRQIWGQQYTRKVADLLGVETDIAGAVSQRLRAQLAQTDRAELLARDSTSSPEAYQLYLKGKYHTSKFTRDEFRKGIDYFNQAIEKDPDYALAYGGLAYYYILQDDWYLPPSVSASRAKAAAQKALSIDPSNAEAHFAMALELHWYEWDWTGAEREFRQAISLNPDYPDAYVLYAWYLVDMGRSDEAVKMAAKAQSVDPLSSIASLGPGAISLFTQHWDAAIKQLQGAVDLDKTYWLTSCFLGRAYEAKGAFPQATAAFREAQKLDPEHSEIWSALGHAYAVSGNRDGARKILDHLNDASQSSYVASYNVAIVYAGLGDKGQNFQLA